MRDNRYFKEQQQAKRVDTGEQVTVVEVLPVGLRVFYRVESQNGDLTLVVDSKLRDARPIVTA